ncbi:ATPase of the ABC class-like protein [Angomonas deanei]|nr:ATPase of the ABC class-like protein [Angomonas deanei]|eukprot:EPY24459.1 ATPase of the ABC class-like protein [Angomonas deanei]
MSRDWQYLEDVLLPMDNGNYSRLKSLTGREFSLETSDRNRTVKVKFHHVQSDPYAPGSQVEIKMDLPFAIGLIQSEKHMRPDKYNIHYFEDDRQNQFFNRFYYNAVRQEAAEDFLLREFWDGLDEVYRRRNSGRAPCPRGDKFIYQGDITVARPSCHILPRSAVQICWSPTNGRALYAGTSDTTTTDVGRDYVSIFMKVKLPGHGRRIDARGALRTFYDEVLHVVETRLYVAKGKELLKHINANVNQEWLRTEIKKQGLVCFVADGSILPRKKGNSEEPLSPVDGAGKKDVVLFASPPTMRRTFELPCSLDGQTGTGKGDSVVGMGVPEGLTLIAGGGFHGKSTLLLAIQNGVYNYHPMDGRYCCVTRADCVKIRAEDRRPVTSVDISLFIRNLPTVGDGRGAADTTCFTTQDASGSTSQAANIMESVELGSTLLLMDEDTCATNLLIRDKFMSELIPSGNEPITTLYECVDYFLNFKAHREKAEDISFIMVVGGSGQYFNLAHTVVVMNRYRAEDATAHAKSIIERARTEAPYLLQPKDSRPPVWPSIVPFDRCFYRSESFKAFTGPQHRPVKSKGNYYKEKYGKKNSAASEEEGDVQSGMRIGNNGMTSVTFNRTDEIIDVRYIEQLCEEGQLNGISSCVAMLLDEGNKVEAHVNGKRDGDNYHFTPAGEFIYPRSLTLSRTRHSKYSETVQYCEYLTRAAQMYVHTPSNYGSGRGFVSLFRTFELGAAINRYRRLCVKK